MPTQCSFFVLGQSLSEKDRVGSAIRERRSQVGCACNVVVVLVDGAVRIAEYLEVCQVISEGNVFVPVCRTEAGAVGRIAGTGEYGNDRCPDFVHMARRPHLVVDIWLFEVREQFCEDFPVSAVWARRRGP